MVDTKVKKLVVISVAEGGEQGKLGEGLKVKQEITKQIGDTQEVNTQEWLLNRYREWCGKKKR